MSGSTFSESRDHGIMPQMGAPTTPSLSSNSSQHLEVFIRCQNSVPFCPRTPPWKSAPVRTRPCAEYPTRTRRAYGVFKRHELFPNQDNGRREEKRKKEGLIRHIRVSQTRRPPEN